MIVIQVSALLLPSHVIVAWLLPFCRQKLPIRNVKGELTDFETRKMNVVPRPPSNFVLSDVFVQEDARLGVKSLKIRPMRCRVCNGE